MIRYDGRAPIARIVIRIRSRVRPARSAELYFLPYIFLLRLTTDVVVRPSSVFSGCTFNYTTHRCDAKKKRIKANFFIGIGISADFEREILGY